jgi:hypothetical protein
MAKLIKLVGMLLQTKVYLFWQAQNEASPILKKKLSKRKLSSQSFFGIYS